MGQVGAERCRSSSHTAREVCGLLVRNRGLQLGQGDREGAPLPRGQHERLVRALPLGSQAYYLDRITDAKLRNGLLGVATTRRSVRRSGTFRRPARGRRRRLHCGRSNTLFEHQAPQTVQALWDRLPIVDRTIQARWSGDAWRTEGNYELLTRDREVENKAGRLSAGEVIYYPGYNSGLLKIAFAYGNAQWLAPFMVPLPVSLIGKINTNLDAFVERCQSIIFEGPLEVEITRL